MTPLLDNISEQGGERYVGLLNEFREILWNAMRQNPLDARQREFLKASAINSAVAYRETEETAFEFSLDQVAEEVERRFLRDTGASLKFDEIEFASEYLVDIQRFFSTELTSQIQRDITQAEKRYSDFRLSVFTTSKVTNSPEEAHVLALLDSREQMKFYFRDRGGRRHPSQKFVRGLLRHSLLIAGVELYSMAASYAASHMEVDNPGSKSHGLKVGFRSEQGYPLLADIRDEIFHPNSNAFLKAVI